MKRSQITTAVALGLAAGVTIAAQPTPLLNNPFDRPSSLLVDNGAPIDRTDGAGGQQVELRATMVGPKTMLADVGGRILRPGDVIGDFELLRVFEDRAVFRFHNDVVTVLVKPPPEDIDD